MRRIHWLLAGLALAIGAGALAQVVPTGLPARPTFQKVTVNAAPSNEGVVVNGSANQNALDVIGNSTTGQSFGAIVTAGTNSSDTAFLVRNQAGTVQMFKALGDGTTSIGGSVWGPHCVYKHGTESRFSTTTLTADSNLTLTIAQNGYYKHTMWIELGGGGAGAGGFKWSFTGTAATSGRGESGVKNGVAFSNSEVSVLATVGTPITTLATATNDWVHTEGVIHITSAPQTVALQWAQNSSSTDTTSVLGDSYMCIDRIE